LHPKAVEGVYKAKQTGVLLLKSLQFLGLDSCYRLRPFSTLIGPRPQLLPTVLLTPAVVRLIGDFQQLADLRNLLPFTKLNVSPTQLGNNLINCVSVLLHDQESFPAIQPGDLLPRN